MMCKRILRVISKVITVIVIGIYLIQLYLMIQSTQTNRLPKIFGWGEVVFLSGSMEPSIKTGSLALIHEQDSYEVDDIVTYVKDYTLITHRIIEVQGDANNVEDEPITKNMIEGKVVCSVPYIGTVIRQLKTPIGMAGVAGIGMMIILWPDKEEEDEIENK